MDRAGNRGERNVRTASRSGIISVAIESERDLRTAPKEMVRSDLAALDAMNAVREEMLDQPPLQARSSGNSRSQSLNAEPIALGADLAMACSYPKRPKCHALGIPCPEGIVARCFTVNTELRYDEPDVRSPSP